MNIIYRGPPPELITKLISIPGTAMYYENGSHASLHCFAVDNKNVCSVGRPLQSAQHVLTSRYQGAPYEVVRHNMNISCLPIIAQIPCSIS